MREWDFQNKLIERLHSNEEFAYDNASIYTVLLDLVRGNGLDEVINILNEIQKETTNKIPTAS